MYGNIALTGSVPGTVNSQSHVHREQRQGVSYNLGKQRHEKPLFKRAHRMLVFYGSHVVAVHTVEVGPIESV